MRSGARRLPRSASITTCIPGAPKREVIGVVQNVRDNGVQEPAPAIVYWPSFGENIYRPGQVTVERVMAVLLGVIGIYRVISYVVSQRRREIGIRLALGAQRRELRGMFVRYGLKLAGAGVAIGWGASAALMRLMKNLLFGISPLDPLTYAVVPVVLLAAAVFASYVPARRAAEVDPVETLRVE